MTGVRSRGIIAVVCAFAMTMLNSGSLSRDKTGALIEIANRVSGCRLALQRGRDRRRPWRLEFRYRLRYFKTIAGGLKGITSDKFGSGKSGNY